MAKAKAKVQVVDKWKKKRWHRIIAPKIFNEQVIGETISAEPNLLSGRTISLNLMHLTRDMKKQNMNLIFEIVKVLGDTAYTDIKQFEIHPSSIRRFVRKGKKRIDDSFMCLTADSRKVRIKPLMITSSSVKGSIITAIRKKAREFLVSRIRKTNSDVLVQDIVNHRIQKEIRDAVSKIYPIKISEIRVLSFVKEEKKEGTAEAEPAAEKTEEPRAEEKIEERTEEKKEAETEDEKEEKKPKKKKEAKKEPEKKEEKEKETEETIEEQG